jgi:hypothetical protein
VGQGIEREVQLQDIDSPLSQQSELASFRVLSNQLQHAVIIQASSAGDSLQLIQGSSRANVGVEPASGGGNQIDRDGRVVARICGT